MDGDRVIRILKEDIDIHEGDVTVYRRHRTSGTKMTYPLCIWRIEKNGIVAAWASDVALVGGIRFVGGNHPAVVGHMPPMPVAIPDAVYIPPRLIRERRLTPHTVILTSDGEVWCPANRSGAVGPR
jgi:hypothetical protein